ncbi:MAG: antibiotic biosynthesis monooxygenase, partial [Actinomycetota bacterium]|nr:antibiotic biosynthesis monooxygenase [Actinomycetota bacterium]
MAGPAYTLARWYVKEGREAEFVAAWSGDLADYFLTLPGCGWGMLLQSIDDPREFYSFGPWASFDDIRNMRADPRTQEVFDVLRELCEEMRPGVFRHVVTLGAASEGGAEPSV